MLSVLAQIQDTFEPTPTLNTPVDITPISSGIDTSSLLVDYWSVFVLILIVLVALYLFIQRYLMLANALRDDGTFMNRVKDYLTEGKIESALKTCKNKNIPASRVIGKGITMLGRPLPDILQVMDQLKSLELKRLQRKAHIFRLLYVLAVCVTGLGLATWVGELFYIASIYGGEMLDNPNILIPVYGLVVGIISSALIYLAYFIIKKRVSDIEISIETRVIEFTNFLNKPAA